MIRGFAILLMFQLAGELIVLVYRLPVSGPICGMALLLGALAWRGREVPQDLGTVANGLLPNMSILFVPVGVGVMAYWGLLARDGLSIGVALVGSALLTIAATALLVRWISRSSASKAWVLPRAQPSLGDRRLPAAAFVGAGQTGKAKVSA